MDPRPHWAYVRRMSGDPIKGRGAAENPPNRFDRFHYEVDPEVSPDDLPSPKTEFLKDATRRILATNDSPDVGFNFSLNPYRGCEHGCSYCFARPSHEYLGFSAGLDFETRILVKEDAPDLLRKELASPKWEPQTVMVSGVTDPYQPVERTLKLTRRCLEVFAAFRNPVALITKNELIARDADILGDLAKDKAAAAFVSITTLDPALSRIMEPRASTPDKRLEALRTLSAAGVPCGVMVAPVVPGLTDHEMPRILAAAKEAGASLAGFVVLRLPGAVAPLFIAWLERHFPDRKDKVLSKVLSLRDGKLYDPSYFDRQRGHGPYAEQIERLFEITSKRLGLSHDRSGLSAAAFRNPDAAEQLKLF